MENIIVCNGPLSCKEILHFTSLLRNKKFFIVSKQILSFENRLRLRKGFHRPEKQK